MPIHEWFSNQRALAYVSNSEMSNFFSEQGRTRVYAETYFSYVAGENPRRTPLRGKRAIYGWKLAINFRRVLGQAGRISRQIASVEDVKDSVRLYVS